MNGNAEVIELLNEVLTAELTADQPVLHRRQDVRQLGLRQARPASSATSRSTR